MIAGTLLATIANEDVCGLGLMFLIITALYGLVFYSIHRVARKFTKHYLLVAIILTVFIMWVTGGPMLLITAGVLAPPCYGHSFSL